jgi:hypothetical protein
MRVTSSALDAERYDMRGNDVPRYKCLAAAASYIMSGRDCERMARQVTRDVVQLGGKPLTWTEKLKADETSLLLKVFDNEPTVLERITRHAQAVCPASVSFGSTASAQKAKTKILQTLRYYSLLFRLPSGTHLLIFFEYVVPLQMMSSTKADVYFHCFTRSASIALEVLSRSFARRQRLVTSDADASPALALRGIAKTTRIPNWHASCEPHKLANIVDSVLRPMESDISCMIKFDLSLQNANAMRTFRDTSRNYIDNKLGFRLGLPSKRDMDYITACLDAFLGSASKTDRFKRVMIKMLMNGPWQEHGYLVHVCGGCCRDRADCVNKMCAFFVVLFVAVGPTVWPRHRWKGARAAKNWLNLLESCHGSVTQLYPLWAASQRGGKWVADLLERMAGSVVALELEDGEAVEDDAFEGGGDVGEPGPGRGSDDAPEVGRDVGGGAAPGVEQSDQRGDQDRNRRDACVWLLRTTPFPRLIVIGVAIDILEGMMDEYLQQAGAPFETKREMDAAAALAAPDACDAVGFDNLRVFMALDGVITKPALRRVRAYMHDSGAWNMLPGRFATAALRTRAACILSGIGCQVAALQSEHENYPFKLFDVLRGDSAAKAERIESEPSCRFDEWTEDFIATHVAEGLHSADSCADLQSTALLQEFDMCNVEAGHAWIRRYIYSRSVHTHQMAAHDANTEFVLGKVRSLSVTPVGQQRYGKFPKKPAAGGDGCSAKSKASSRGGGGAWRAFVREMLLGKKRGEVSLKDVGQWYRDVSAEQKERLILLGRDGAAAARNGGAAFGMTQRQQDRILRKRMLVAEAASLRIDDRQKRPRIGALEPECETIGARVAGPELVEGEDAWAKLLVFKNAVKLDRQAHLIAKKALVEEACEWEATKGKCVVDSIVSSYDLSKHRATEFSCNPICTSGLVALRWRPVRIRERVRHILRLQARTAAAKKLFETLGKAWKGLSTTIQHETAAVLSTVTPKQCARPCHAAGRCVHTGIGLKIAKLAANIDSCAKAVIKESEENRRKFVWHEVACIAVGQAREIVDGVLTNSGPPTIRCVHIGNASLSPFFMQYHEMEIEGVDICHELGAPARVRATFRNAYSKRISFASTFDLRIRWSVCFMKAIFEERCLGVFVPNCLDLEPISDDRSFHIVWDPWGLKPSLKTVVGFDKLLEDEESEEHDAVIVPESMTIVDSLCLKLCCCLS